MFTFNITNSLMQEINQVLYLFIKKKYALKIFRYLFNIYFSFILNMDYLDLEKFKTINLPESIECIKMQELGFLSEYYFITILFCLTLFSLFSLKLIIDNDRNFSIKFKYNNQLIFLLIFGLICYLVLLLQQINIYTLSLLSFNNTIHNDQLSLIAKFVIGLSSILYLIFITQYLKRQRLSTFEYYIILFTSIFGVFLLCGANDFDLVTVYLAIELQGLSFYILASFKKSPNFSVESGVKYFVLGSLSTAIFLLGTTFIYGCSGSVLLTDFKDFFIWVFSANSFFLSFDSIFKSLEVFQERIASSENLLAIKTNKLIYNILIFKENLNNLVLLLLECCSGDDAKICLYSGAVNVPIQNHMDLINSTTSLSMDNVDDVDDEIIDNIHEAMWPPLRPGRPVPPAAMPFSFVGVPGIPTISMPLGYVVGPGARTPFLPIYIGAIHPGVELVLNLGNLRMEFPLAPLPYIDHYELCRSYEDRWGYDPMAPLTDFYGQFSWYQHNKQCLESLVVWYCIKIGPLIELSTERVLSTILEHRDIDYFVRNHYLGPELRYEAVFTEDELPHMRERFNRMTRVFGEGIGNMNGGSKWALRELAQFNEIPEPLHPAPQGVNLWVENID